MKKLCFGSFTTILVRCKANTITQKQLCGTVLLSVAPTYDIRTDDDATSALVRGHSNLSANITDVLQGVDNCAVAEYFKQHIVPMLNGNKKSDAVLAIKDIIASDETIKHDTVIDAKNNMTKADIGNRTAFVIEDFLAGVFLYTATNIENRGNEENVKEITLEYVQSFESHGAEISFITVYSSFPTEAVNELAANSHLVGLLTETGGKCQKCGRPLGITKDGNDISYATIVRLSETEDTVLCVDCERETIASDEIKATLILDKRELVNNVQAMDATYRISLEGQIGEVLRAIDQIEVTTETGLKHDPVKVENKITEIRLREKALWHVTRLYDAVNSSLDQLSAENKLNVDKFAKSIRRMFEDASETLTSQSDIYNHLVNALFEKSGRKHKEACEIIISYFVQRCEVFNEIAE